MNEITRIHIAKVAYDIEVTAKKQLEKYIKSLETYTQDAEVLADIEIRITELLTERGVAAGGVISTDDVAAIRKQLGEPYEFANEDGDIAVGAVEAGDDSHRLYRSLDDAVLGGVLSGIAAYFKVNPLWTRLIFILLAFISFGILIVAYLAFWLILPPARTAAEKLKLVGKPVTLESIRELNAAVETAKPYSVAPLLRKVIRIGLGIASLFAAITTLVALVWGGLFVVLNNGLDNVAFSYLGEGTELAWVVFWIIAFGTLMLAALFSLIAYALFAKKLTKSMVVSGIVIIALGLMSAGVAIGITATQTVRAQSEAQSLMQTTKINLPKDFANVKTVVFENPSESQESEPRKASYYAAVNSIQYIVDEGTPRYELSALPKVKMVVKIDGETARVSVDIPESRHNPFVQPSLIIYGPALEGVESHGVQVNYSNAGSQDALNISLPKFFGNVTISGTYKTVVASGKGSVDASSSAIETLDVRSTQDLSVSAGTVRDLLVVQSDVCGNINYTGSTSVSVSGVSSGLMTYNGKQSTAETYRSDCASVVVGDNADYGHDYYSRNE